MNVILQQYSFLLTIMAHQPNYVAQEAISYGNDRNIAQSMEQE